MLPILYLQLSLPEFSFKIGVTNRGLMKRSKAIWSSTKGIQLPILFVVTPFNKQLEKWMHKHFAAHRRPKKTGSGRTEWFTPGLAGVVLLEAVSIFLAIWISQLLLIAIVFKYVISS